MRALFITIAIALLGVGGYLIYTHMAPAAPQRELFAEPVVPEAPPPEECLAANAVYEYREDRRLLLSFAPIAAANSSEPQLAEVQGRSIGNLTFVVRLTSMGEDVRFTPVANADLTGPLWSRSANFVRAAEGGDRIQVALFNSEMRYLDGLPRADAPAPAHIYMPELMRYLYRRRVDLPPGMFEFSHCNAPAAP